MRPSDSLIWPGDGVVDRDEFDRWVSAYAYGGASSMGVVEAGVSRLRGRIAAGQPVVLFRPGEPPLRTTKRRHLEAWVAKHFPFYARK